MRDIGYHHKSHQPLEPVLMMLMATLNKPLLEYASFFTELPLSFIIYFYKIGPPTNVCTTPCLILLALQTIGPRTTTSKFTLH